jgi:hypothetical protein
VSQTTIAAYLDKTTNVLLHLTTQFALYAILAVDNLAQTADFAFRELAHARRRVNPALCQYLTRARQPDAVDIRQRILDLLISWQVYTSNACQSTASSTLTLLVFRVLFADDPNHTSAPYDFAIVADFLH